MILLSILNGGEISSIGNALVPCLRPTLLRGTGVLVHVPAGALLEWGRRQVGALDGVLDARFFPFRGFELADELLLATVLSLKKFPIAIRAVEEDNLWPIVVQVVHHLVRDPADELPHQIFHSIILFLACDHCESSSSNLAALLSTILSVLVLAIHLVVVQLPAQRLPVPLKAVVARQLARPVRKRLRRPVIRDEPSAAGCGGAHGWVGDAACADLVGAAAGAGGTGLEGRRGAGMICGRECPLHVGVVKVIREVALRVDGCDVGLREEEGVESSIASEGCAGGDKPPDHPAAGLGA
eukprot:2476398-Rhodomonas_salina.4